MSPQLPEIRYGNGSGVGKGAYGFEKRFIIPHRLSDAEDIFTIGIRSDRDAVAHVRLKGYVSGALWSNAEIILVTTEIAKIVEKIIHPLE